MIKPLPTDAKFNHVRDLPLNDLREHLAESRLARTLDDPSEVERIVRAALLEEVYADHRFSDRLELLDALYNEGVWA